MTNLLFSLLFSCFFLLLLHFFSIRFFSLSHVDLILSNSSFLPTPASVSFIKDIIGLSSPFISSSPFYCASTFTCVIEFLSFTDHFLLFLSFSFYFNLVLFFALQMLFISTGTTDELIYSNKYIIYSMMDIFNRPLTFGINKFLPKHTFQLIISSFTLT